MKISILQYDIAWEDKIANFDRLRKLIANDPEGSDLYILPEMFNSGFSMNVSKIAEAPQSDTFAWMSEIAAKTGAAVCGSYAVREGDKCFNRWVFVSPDKVSYHYDKRHIFSMGGEDKAFSPGHRRVVFTFRKVRICPTVCYDLRFPVWSRNRNDYDLLINSANWPVKREEVWETLVKARAIENHCYFAASNRTGSDGTGATYCGKSAVIDPKGKIISTPYNSEEAVINCRISLDELTDFRKKFPVWKDADEFKIKE
jgi:omega-amidase